VVEQKKISVLVVDDSALVRKLLPHLLNSHPQICVVDTAIDARDARGKIKQLKPDVVTLDIEMPGMSGLGFLEKLMILHPTPVVMVSTLTKKGASASLEAMRLGAFDFIAKPQADLSRNIDAYREELHVKVLGAAVANIAVLANRAKRHLEDTPTVDRLPDVKISSASSLQPIIAVGASTGGTEAIAQFLQCLPANTPGMVVTQHIPGMFSSSFAKRLDDQSALTVAQAKHGDRVLAGHVYVAPGDAHLSLKQDGANFVCCLDSGPTVNRHRPSVDVLFNSVAESVKNLSVGVLLTGMGKDGAKGLLSMKEVGARTIIQDEASSVVWGMPGAAFKLGAAEHVLPLEEISERVLNVVSKLR